MNFFEIRFLAGKSLVAALNHKRQSLSSVNSATSLPGMAAPNTKFLEKYGPWAVVTGASSGIGAEFARQLAEAGLSVVLVARRPDRLEALASALRDDHRVQAKTIAADLGTPAGRAAVASGTSDLDVGLLINNAGVELHGSFFRDTAEQHVNLIEVNVTAVTFLAHVIGRRIAARGRGGIVFVSSISSRPMPWWSTYASSKAFVTSLGLILGHELRPKGVDVLALEPGPTDVGMTQRVGQTIDFGKLGSTMMPVEQCVGEALTQLLAGTARYTPGFMNRVQQFIIGLMPEWLQMKTGGIAMARSMDPELFKYS